MLDNYHEDSQTVARHQCYLVPYSLTYRKPVQEVTKDRCIQDSHTEQNAALFCTRTLQANDQKWEVWLLWKFLVQEVASKLDARNLYKRPAQMSLSRFWTVFHQHEETFTDCIGLVTSKYKFGLPSFRVSAPTIRNSIPHSVCSCESLTTFRKHLKTLYFQLAFFAAPATYYWISIEHL